MRVEAIYISPVKSLALLAAQRVTLGKHGIVEDRRFFLVNDRARLVTQREVAPLTQVRAAYTIEPEVLRLRFPDGRTVEGTPVSGEPITARFFGERDVEGFVVGGDWGAALSEFAGMRLRLVRAAKSAFDGFPGVDPVGGVGRGAAHEFGRAWHRRTPLPAELLHLRPGGARRGRVDRR